LGHRFCLRFGFRLGLRLGFRFRLGFRLGFRFRLDLGFLLEPVRGFSFASLGLGRHKDRRSCRRRRGCLIKHGDRDRDRAWYRRRDRDLARVGTRWGEDTRWVLACGSSRCCGVAGQAVRLHCRVTRFSPRCRRSNRGRNKRAREARVHKWVAAVVGRDAGMVAHTSTRSVFVVFLTRHAQEPQCFVEFRVARLVRPIMDRHWSRDFVHWDGHRQGWYAQGHGYW